MSFGPLLDSFRGVRVLVVGDLMLDEYHFGQATRISPEAPVMVIRHTRTEHLPGGAANVALNLKALGADPLLIGVAGLDPDGNALERCLAESSLEGFRLFRDQGRPTTKKTRIVADHSHQVLRLDFESEVGVSPEVELPMIKAIREEVPRSSVVVVSDYLKGVCQQKLVEWTMKAAKEAKVPVVVNPKPRSLHLYESASLVSLNRLEASQSLGDVSDPDAEKKLDVLRRNAGLPAVLVTMGEKGMAAAGSALYRIPAPQVEVYDTAGAGDTVIATVALGMASVGFKKEVFELAAQTAACVVRHVGVATPSREDLEAIRRL